MIIKFLIEGTPFDPKGNPIPYTRVTQRTANARNPRWVRYAKWQGWVQSAFLKQNPDNTGLGHYSLMAFRHGRPVLLSEDLTARVDIKIQWKDKKGMRADGDNVLKGILDALIVNDKFVSKASFDTAVSADGKGMVEIEIEFFMFGNPIADNMTPQVQVAVLKKSNEIVREIAAKKFKALAPKKK